MEMKNPRRRRSDATDDIICVCVVYCSCMTSLTINPEPKRVVFFSNLRMIPGSIPEKEMHANELGMLVSSSKCQHYRREGSGLL